MKVLLLMLTIGYSSAVFAQKAGSIDLTHWKLELPSGYSAAEWKLSNFQNDRFAKPFFYLDSIDGALVMDAYPVHGTSSAKYTKNSLREQMIPGKSSKNWTLAEGGVLKAEFQVAEMSKEDGKKYHRTLLFQIQGRTSESQDEELDLEKGISESLLSVFWQDERIRVVRKKLKDVGTIGENLFKKESWENDQGRYFNKKIGFERAVIEIVVSEDQVEIRLNDEKPIVYRDLSIKRWPFENYFVAGNYLQTRDTDAFSRVKFYELKVNH